MFYHCHLMLPILLSGRAFIAIGMDFTDQTHLPSMEIEQEVVVIMQNTAEDTNGTSLVTFSANGNDSPSDSISPKHMTAVNIVPKMGPIIVFVT